MALEFRVLGTLEVTSDGGRVSLPSTRHQRVVAALLLAPNSVVPVSKLVEAVWDDEPPATAVKQVQNCVSVLRERLGGGSRVIVTDGPGYRIVVTEDQLDLMRFHRGLSEARRLAAEGRLADAVREARAGLGLWRGSVLDGIHISVLTNRVTLLNEQRLGAVEQCVDWQLELGEHREVAAELMELVAEHPLREKLHAQLMLALNRCGRQADALQVFHELRIRLVEELGIDPGRDVLQLHERILAGEPRPPRAAPGPPAAEAGHDPVDDAPAPVAAVRDDRLDRAVRELASAISRQWTVEVEMRSLNRPEPVPLRWSSTGRQVAAVASAVLGAGADGDRPDCLGLSGGLDDVVEQFRKLPTRQLVVLGEPGAGKSVLAILLTLGLLAELRPDDPIPVLLPLASWNPHEEHLHAWLARRLVEEYPALANRSAYGPDAATRLVLEGRVVPVLDGLDETPPALHAAAIDALDRAVAGGRPVVVTCRSTDYELAVNQAGSMLARAAVVEIEPVGVDDAIAFLTARRRLGETRWQPVVDHLRRHPAGVLAQALGTPLMVDLARTAYAHPASDPADLCDTTRFPDRGTVERHLLDAYLPAVYRQAPAPPGQDDRPASARSYDPVRAERWLTFLARHAHRLPAGDLAWWQLDKAVPRPVSSLYLSLPAAVLFAVAGWLAGGPVIGLIYGLAFAGAGCLAHAVGRRPGPQRVEFRIRGTTRRFLSRFAIGVVMAVSLGLGWSLSVGFVLLLAVVFGLAVGVHVWLDTPVDARRVSSPASVLRNDRVAALWFSLSLTVSLGLFYGMAYAFTREVRFIDVLGGRFDFALVLAGGLAAALLGRFLMGNTGSVAYGLAGAVVGGLVFPRAPNPSSAVAVGIMFGLAVGLATGLSRAWGYSVLTRLWLAVRGHTPFRLLRFLDDAHRRGVLRQVGAVYQFRHLRLEERLSDRATQEAGSSARRRAGLRKGAQPSVPKGDRSPDVAATDQRGNMSVTRPS
ncbi:BTAD domain-containing putative transcriptional regulator [Pseudonocardia xinjiangensis]|uniref:BTAD domain-containing putative transcriptional regulator n=1 Tax=Pseudonocardia xinjiangensis TaxID=75289 RepID=UPI003D8A0AA8